MGKNQPAHIRRAMLCDDVPLLRAAGRKGGLAVASKRRREQERDRILASREAERRQHEERERREAANEHVIPVDPSDPDTPDSYR